MAKVRAQGADIRITGITEVTYGTAPVTGHNSLLVSSFDPGYREPLNHEQELGTGPEATDPYYDPKQVQPSIEVHGRIREMGFWLKHMFGAPVSAGTPIVTHTFETGKENPSLSIERGHPSIITPRYELITGYKLGTMDIDLERTGPLKLQLGGVAQNYGESGTPVDASPTAFSAGKFFNKTLAPTWNSAAIGSVVSGRIQISNELEAVETIRADQLIDGADETVRTVVGSIRFRMTSDTTLRDDALAGTPRELVLEWSTPINAGWFFRLTMPRVYLEPSSPPITGAGGVEQEFSMRASKPAGAPMLTAELLNDETSY